MEQEDFYRRFLRDQKEILRREAIWFNIGLVAFLLFLLAIGFFLIVEAM